MAKKKNRSLRFEALVEQLERFRSENPRVIFAKPSRSLFDFATDLADDLMQAEPGTYTIEGEFSTGETTTIALIVLAAITGNPEGGTSEGSLYSMKVEWAGGRPVTLLLKRNRPKLTKR